MICSYIFDDILIYCPNWNSHLSHLKLVFNLLSSNHLIVKWSKCEFATQLVNYLGHIITDKGVAAISTKIGAVIDCPCPSSIQALYGFLGLVGFYWHFVRGYTHVVGPLTCLLCKKTFTWFDEAEQAFNELKKHLTTTPLLHLSDFALLFVVKMDASNIAMGVVLQQEHRPIAFFRCA